MDKQNLFHSSQHGFRKGRSCLSQLLAHHDFVLRLLAEGQNVNTVYLDFAKAFDKVDFNIVLSKMKKIGIHGKILDFIKAFLANRT